MAIINRKDNLNRDLEIFNTNSEVIIVDEKCIDFNKNIALQICEHLKSNGISSLIVEGGAKTLNTIIKENLWDEMKVFKSPKNIKNGVNAPLIGDYKSTEVEIAEDKLITYINI